MDVLWASSSPMTGREVLRAIEGRDLAYATVKTVLDRLTRKGVVRRTAVDGSRALVYLPAIAREAYIAELMREVLDLATDRDAALSHFARSVTDPEAAVIRHALDDSDQASPEGTG